MTLTVILWGLTYQKRFLPPPNILTLIANVINPVFCFTNKKDDDGIDIDGFPEEDILPTGAKEIKNYCKEWNGVYLAINNLLLAIFSLIYFGGMIASFV